MNLGGKQNLSAQNIDQPLEVGGFKIAFRTMPQDMEALGLSAATILQPKETPSAQPTKTKTADIEDIYREAKSLYNRKFYQAAIEKLEELTNLQKSHLRAQWLLYRARKKFRKSQSQEKKGPSVEDYATLAAEQKEAREKMEKAGYVPPIAPFPLPTTQKKQIQEAEKAKLLEQIRQEEQKKAQALQEMRHRELMERKLAEEIEKRKREIARQQEERERAQLQEKLLREKEEREMAERKLVEETEKQKRLERQLREAAIAPPSSSSIPLPIQPSSLPTPPPPIQPQPITPEPAQYQQAAPENEENIIFFSKKQGFPFFSAKALELIGAAFLIVIIFSGLVYWIGWKKLHSSAPSTNQPSAQSEQVLPTSLFSVDETLSISLQIGQKKMLFRELEKISERDQTSGTFARILVKFVSEEGTQNYASLGDLIDSLQIAFPTEILNNLDKNNYTLFIYAQKKLPSSPFAISLGKNKLGLIVAMTNRENMSQKFLSWEKTMPQDLDALFLGKKISFPTQYQFTDIPYREVLIRAFDMPDQFSSLNYTFSDNKIIIATSLETTEALVDKLAR